MVAMPDKVNLRTVLPAAKTTKHSEVGPQTGNNLFSKENETGSFSHLRRLLQSDGVPKQATEIIIKSWRQSTQKQYHSYIESWFKFCGGKDNPISPNINTVLAFLTSLYDKGLGYSSINTARSVISSFLQVSGKFDIHVNGRVSRFMKGVLMIDQRYPDIKPPGMLAPCCVI